MENASFLPSYITLLLKSITFTVYMDETISIQQHVPVQESILFFTNSPSKSFTQRHLVHSRR